MGGRYLKYVFPPSEEDDVCMLQNTAGPGFLLLNGNYANEVWSQVSFIAKGFSKHLTFTSLNDLSAVSFLITGTCNGVLVTEVILGPNAETVTTVNTFDTVTSIVSTNAVNGVSVGSSSIDGYICPILQDDNGLFPVPTLALQFPIQGQFGTVEMTLLISVDYIADTGFTYQQMKDSNRLIAVGTIPFPVFFANGAPNYANALLNITATDPRDSMEAVIRINQ